MKRNASSFKVSHTKSNEMFFEVVLVEQAYFEEFCCCWEKLLSGGMFVKGRDLLFGSNFQPRLERWNSNISIVVLVNKAVVMRQLFCVMSRKVSGSLFFYFLLSALYWLRIAWIQVAGNLWAMRGKWKWKIQIFSLWTKKLSNELTRTSATWGELSQRRCSQWKSNYRKQQCSLMWIEKQ